MAMNHVLICCVLLSCVSLSVGFQNGDLRLIGGRLSNEGRVEVYHNRQWGTICDDGWDMNDAQVVCRQLNFPGAQSAVEGGVYQQGTGPIWLDDLNCKGTETDLSHCVFKGWGITDCSHSEDAGVVCEKATAKNNSRVYKLEHNAGLSKHLGKLLDSGRGCDLNLAVVVDSTTVETLCIHRLILSLVLDSDVSQGNLSSISINVSTNCHTHVPRFVRYVYTRQIDITVSSAQCIHKMASDWALKELQEEAGGLFSQLLTEDPTFQTQSSLYEYAVHTGDMALQQTCLRYLAWNCEALIRSPAWKHLPLATLKALLPRSDLLVPNEMHLLRSLESWLSARGNSTSSKDRRALFKHIRFPMIPADDLYGLKGLHYLAGKLEGFQYNALSAGSLSGEPLRKWRAFTPRIYTEERWSFTYIAQHIQTYKLTGNFNTGTQQSSNLAASFRTPIHNSAYFALVENMTWYTHLDINRKCSVDNVVCPKATLRISYNGNLPNEVRSQIVYQNKVVLMCEEEYVFHVQDFKDDPATRQPEAILPGKGSVGQAYPCHSDIFYIMVVRPMYAAGNVFSGKYEEEEEEGSSEILLNCHG